MHARRLLAQLVAAAVDLPREDTSDDAPDGARPGTDIVTRVRATAAALPIDTYPMFYTPGAQDQAAVTGSLVDDVLDMHADVAEGLSLFAGGHTRAAAWTWRWSFDTHWGRHATQALAALHAWVADGA